MASLKETFWSYYSGFFSTKSSAKLIDGEECHNDILKCFEYSGDSKKYARAKEDIEVYKATRVFEDNEKKGHCVTTLIIPKGARVHLGNNYQKYTMPQEVDKYLQPVKCRAEEVRVVKTDSISQPNKSYSFYLLWNGKEMVRTVYKNGETVKPNRFYDQETIMECSEYDGCADISDVTCASGIHFFLRKSYAEQYGKL